MLDLQHGLMFTSQAHVIGSDDPARLKGRPAHRERLAALTVVSLKEWNPVSLAAEFG